MQQFFDPKKGVQSSCGSNSEQHFSAERLHSSRVVQETNNRGAPVCQTENRDKKQFLISSEEINLKNITEAIHLGFKCFPLAVDRAILSLTYLAYSSDLLKKIPLPEPVLKGWARLELYQLYRDQEGKSIGISGLYRYDQQKDSLWLGWLGISPELQGQGLGSQLVKDLEKTALKMGVKFLKTYMDADNQDLLRFYQKIGYQQQGEILSTASGKVRILQKDLTLQ
jgi:GNAT superfamily N-acetyltransferase